MTTNDKIGLVIKQLRTNGHLSQEKLSCHCGVDQHYINNLEGGQRSVSVDIIERIASCFGLSLSQFFAHVDSIQDQAYSTSPSASEEEIIQRFIRFMKEQFLSEKTIKKYSADTPNSPSVQRIIKEETGFTDNMYRVFDIAVLDRIINRVSECTFDIVGHSMYSAGLKKYKAFLESQ